MDKPKYLSEIGSCDRLPGILNGREVSYENCGQSMVFTKPWGFPDDMPIILCEKYYECPGQCILE